MECDRSRALVSVYLDGELGEELASPLRRHLMECAECRAHAAEAKAMSSWFVPAPAMAVPAGFAARVTARAFAGEARAGDPGVLVPASPRAIGDRSLRFAMSLTAAAAALLLGLTLLIASADGPGLQGEGLHAVPNVEDVLKQLDTLNGQDAAQAPEGADPKVEQEVPRER